MRNINDDVTIYDAKAVYFTPRAAGGALGTAENVGVSTAFKLSLATEKKTLKSPTGKKIKTLNLIPEASASIDLRDISPANLARGLKATLVPKAAAVGITKTFTSPKVGDTVFLGAVNVSNLTAKLDDLAAPVGAYTVDPAFGMITFNATLDGEFAVTYDTAAQNVFGLLTAPNQEYDIKALIVDLSSNKPRIVHLYRCAVSPTKDLDVIGEDFATMTLEIDVLEDETKPVDTENDMGQYGQIIG